MRLWIWLPEDVWISVVFRRLDGKVRVQERWASTRFSGWAVPLMTVVYLGFHKGGQIIAGH